jgi:hypothetical protein
MIQNNTNIPQNTNHQNIAGYDILNKSQIKILWVVEIWAFKKTR